GSCQQVLGLRRNEEALDGYEWLGFFATGRRDRIDFQVDISIFSCFNVPWSGQEERRVSGDELLLSDIAIYGGLQVAFFAFFSQPLGDLNAAFIADLQVCRVVGPGLIGAEDRCAE